MGGKTRNSAQITPLLQKNVLVLVGEAEPGPAQRRGIGGLFLPRSGAPVERQPFGAADGRPLR
jgi:hypothetical protein